MQQWMALNTAIAVWASESGLDNGFAAGEEFTLILSLNGESFIADSLEMNSSPPSSRLFQTDLVKYYQFFLGISEVAGCTDNTACNYDSSATDDDDHAMQMLI